MKAPRDSRPPPWHADRGASGPSAILFDLDDTLFDHSHSVQAALRRLRELAPALRARPLADLVRSYKAQLDAVTPDVLRGALTIEAARRRRYRRLFEESGATVSSRQLEEYLRVVRSTYRSVRRPVPGARALLEELSKRHTLGIVTNNFRTEQAEKLRAIGLDDLFEFVLTSEEAGVQKPDPAIFSLALERARVEPASAVMIGDHWECDVLGAVDAGISAVWFHRTWSLPRRREKIPVLGSFRPREEAVRVIEAPLRARGDLTSVTARAKRS